MQTPPLLRDVWEGHTTDASFGSVQGQRLVSHPSFPHKMLGPKYYYLGIRAGFFLCKIGMEMAEGRVCSWDVTEEHEWGWEIMDGV